MNIISIFLIIFIIIFLLLITYKNKNIESFSTNTSLNSFSKKHILDDCINNWAKISNASNPELFCETNSWITNPKYLCGICDGSDEKPLYSFKPGNDSTKSALFGCSPSASNSLGLSWNVPANNTINTVKKINTYLGNLQTCNLANIKASSNMYIYVCADDNCTVSLNNKNIITQNGWNQLGVYLIQNVKFGDVISINAVNVCGGGAMCVSYIWNGQLYILDNNGFENSANIINYKLSINKEWSNIWVQYVNKLLPWMKNWLRLADTPTCIQGSTTTATLSFKIGDTQKVGLLTNDLTVFLGIDDFGKVLLNGNQVYDKNQVWNQIATFVVPNVNENDVLTFNCVNPGGPGGIGLTYLWCGMLYTLPSGLNQFNTAANIINYTSINCSDMSYNECNGFPDNLHFMTSWLRSGSDNFSLTTKVGLQGWKYGPSIGTWYTIKQNNYIGQWSITNIKSTLSMTVSFTINIKSISNWRNVFHVSNSNVDWPGSGCRSPAVWVTAGASTLCIINGTSINDNDNFYTKEIPLNTPTDVKIIWSGNNVDVYLNSVLNISYIYNGTITPTNPTASFYIGDPWYSQDGNVQIKDFQIS
jgi:hypothetical protein